MLAAEGTSDFELLLNNCPNDEPLSVLQRLPSTRQALGFGDMVGEKEREREREIKKKKHIHI